MKQEQPLGIAFARMAHRGVPAAAAVDLLTPGDRVVDAHLAAGIGRFIERCQNVYGTARVAAKSCTIRRCAPKSPGVPPSRRDPGPRCGWRRSSGPRRIAAGVATPP